MYLTNVRANNDDEGDGENKIYYQDIELIRADRDFGYIIDGIEDGQRISTTNLKDGINGMLVRIDQQ